MAPRKKKEVVPAPPAPETKPLTEEEQKERIRKDREQVTTQMSLALKESGTKVPTPEQTFALTPYGVENYLVTNMLLADLRGLRMEIDRALRPKYIGRAVHDTLAREEIQALKTCVTSGKNMQYVYYDLHSNSLVSTNGYTLMVRKLDHPLYDRSAYLDISKVPAYTATAIVNVPTVVVGLPYPNFEKIIPKSGDYCSFTSTKKLLAKVREWNKKEVDRVGASIVFRPLRKGQMFFSWAEGPDGWDEISTDSGNFTLPEVARQINIAPHLFLSALLFLGEGEITWMMNSDVQPVLLSTVDESKRVLLMPVRP